MRDAESFRKLAADLAANLPEPDPDCDFYLSRDNIYDVETAEVEAFLLAAMQSQQAAWRRFAAKQSMCFEYHDPKALTAVRQLLLTDPSNDVRATAADALYILNGFDTPDPTILEALKTERDAKVRYELARCGLRLTPRDDRATGSELLGALIDAALGLELEREKVEEGLLSALEWDWNPRLLDVILAEKSGYFRALQLELVDDMRGFAADPRVREYLHQFFQTEQDAGAREVVLEKVLFPQLEAAADPEWCFEKSFIEELLLVALEHHSKARERRLIAAQLKKHSSGASPRAAKVLSSESSPPARVALFEAKLGAEGVAIAGKLAAIASLGRLPPTTEQADALVAAFRAKGEAGVAALVGEAWAEPWVDCQALLRGCTVPDDYELLVVNAPVYDVKAAAKDRALADELAELLRNCGEQSDARHPYFPVVLKAKKGEKVAAALRRALQIPKQAKFTCRRAKTPFIEEYAEEFPSFDEDELKSDETAGLSGDWLCMTKFVSAEEARSLERAAEKMTKALEQLSFVRFPSDSGYAQYPVFRVGLTKSNSLVGVVTMRVEN